MHIVDSAHQILLKAHHKCLIVTHFDIFVGRLPAVSHRNEKWCEHELLRIVKDTLVVVQTRHLLFIV